MASSYAARTAPAGFIVATSPNKGLGVFATRNVSKGEELGQYTGDIVRGAAGIYYMAVCDSNGDEVYGINPRNASYNSRAMRRAIATRTPYMRKCKIVFSREEQQPNWTRFVNSIDPDRRRPHRVRRGERRKQNVAFRQRRNGKVYLFALRDIRGTRQDPVELLAWYGDSFF